MKKTFFIILGILILIFLGIWGYLVVFGVPEGLPNFGRNTEFEEGTEFIKDDALNTTENTVLTGEGTVPVEKALTKLTSRRVAGAIALDSENTSLVRYVEKGTGHIYEVNLETGVEARISNTTVPRTAYAVWAPTGNRVALTTYIEGRSEEIFVGTLSKDDEGIGYLDGFVLPEGATEVSWNSIGDAVRYVAKDENGTRAYEEDLKTKSAPRQLFSVPLRDVTVIFGETTNYLYPKPTASFIGALYEVSGNNILTKVGKSGTGLMAEVTKGYSVLTETDDVFGLRSTVYKKNSSLELAVSVIPEKCDFTEMGTTTLYCGASFEINQERLPDSWYQGITSFNDFLWEIDIENGEALLLSDLESEAGVAIDVGELMVSKERKNIIFTNKKDDTLWRFKL